MSSNGCLSGPNLKPFGLGTVVMGMKGFKISLLADPLISVICNAKIAFELCWEVPNWWESYVAVKDVTSDTLPHGQPTRYRNGKVITERLCHLPRARKMNATLTTGLLSTPKWHSVQVWKASGRVVCKFCTLGCSSVAVRSQAGTFICRAGFLISWGRMR